MIYMIDIFCCVKIILNLYVQFYVKAFRNSAIKLYVCKFELEYYGPANTIKVMLSQSVYLFV